MSDTTKIEWADATFNPWIGCTKVSAGCKNCYAENTTRARVLRSQGHETWGKGAKRSRTSEAMWKQPLRWNRLPLMCDTCGKQFQQLNGRQKLCEPIPGVPCMYCNFGHYRGLRIFPSLCDWLDYEVPIEYLADFLKLIYDTPHLTWLLLTKRPENYRIRIEDAINCLSARGDHEAANAWSGPDELHICPDNVWIGVSVENQAAAGVRIPELLTIPAKVHFLSVEPMLGAIDFLRSVPCGYYCSEEVGHVDHSLSNIHWVIFGGESGPDARPCSVDWIRDGVKQCKADGIPAFVKQLGAYSFKMVPEAGGSIRQWFKDPKGGDMAEWPEDLRVREMPK